jgi:hypothetical protein
MEVYSTMPSQKLISELVRLHPRMDVIGVGDMRRKLAQLANQSNLHRKAGFAAFARIPSKPATQAS